MGPARKRPIASSWQAPALPVSSAIALFAKAPIPGFVKTRLQPHLTAEQSAELHLAFVQDSWASLRSIEGVTLYLYADQRWPGFPRLAGPGRVGLQRGADLGEKMLNCFEELSQRHHRVLIVGSDSPTLPPDYLRTGLELLGGVDAVLGPSEDGGYYAVGCRSAKPGMFQDVSWSAASTLTETEQAFKRAGFISKRLPSWYDIDTIEDLRRLVSAGDLPEPTNVCPTETAIHTARWLRENPGPW